MGEGIPFEGATLHVTASIGIAFSMHPAVAKTLTSAADAALYTAKKAGRNTWHLGSAEDAAITAAGAPVSPAQVLQSSRI
jgi:predicted signal transduction protein with EAL and GGDEF domain